MKLILSCTTLVAAITLTSGAHAALSEPSFTYGRHVPNGEAAVAYLYGPIGNFKPLNNLSITTPYYFPSQYQNSCPNAAGTQSTRDNLISSSKGPNQSSAADPNCHVLFDLDRNGQPDTLGGGAFAFSEHSGYGNQATKIADEFNQFWFDDNWLARYVSTAYGRPHPGGLYASNDYTRWSIIGGDASYWNANLQPYGNVALDHLSFKGLYQIAFGNYDQALIEWNKWLANSGSFYNSANQRFDYPNATEEYYLGFARIHVEHLIKYGNISTNTRDALIQHSVSLRSHIISNQVTANGLTYGWVTERANNLSLMNTETASLQVLGLGVGGKIAYEAGRAPMLFTNSNYFVRPHNVISAVVGLSSPGTMVYGPSEQFPLGPIAVDFYLRAPAPAGTVANIDIYDGTTGVAVAGRTITATMMKSGNRWTKITLTGNVSNPVNRLQFRVGWVGACNLDVAFVQVH